MKLHFFLRILSSAVKGDHFEGKIEEVFKLPSTLLFCHQFRNTVQVIQLRGNRREGAKGDEVEGIF